MGGKKILSTLLVLPWCFAVAVFLVLFTNILDAEAATGDRACYTVVSNVDHYGVIEVFGGTYWARSVGTDYTPGSANPNTYASNIVTDWNGAGAIPGITVTSSGAHVILTKTDDSATSTAYTGFDLSPHLGNYPNSPDGNEQAFQNPSVFNADCGDVSGGGGSGSSTPETSATDSLIVARELSNIRWDLDYLLVLAVVTVCGGGGYRLFIAKPKK